MSEAREIAKVLTEAQRRAVLTDDTYFADHWKGHWLSASWKTAAVLLRHGLVEAKETLARPTPLGLEVRTILEGERS